MLWAKLEVTLVQRKGGLLLHRELARVGMGGGQICSLPQSGIAVDSEECVLWTWQELAASQSLRMGN